MLFSRVHSLRTFKLCVCNLVIRTIFFFIFLSLLTFLIRVGDSNTKIFQFDSQISGNMITFFFGIVSKRGVCDSHTANCAKIAQNSLCVYLTSFFALRLPEKITQQHWVVRTHNSSQCKKLWQRPCFQTNSTDEKFSYTSVRLSTLPVPTQALLNINHLTRLFVVQK